MDWEFNTSFTGLRAAFLGAVTGEPFCWPLELLEAATFFDSWLFCLQSWQLTILPESRLPLITGTKAAPL